MGGLLNPNGFITVNGGNVPFAEVWNDHNHGAQDCYPKLADSVVLTSSASAWTFGAYVELVPVNAITSPFDVHQLSVSNLSDDDEYEMEIASGLSGSEITMCCISFLRSGTATRSMQLNATTVIVPANTRVSARLASKTAVAYTGNIKIHYHTY